MLPIYYINLASRSDRRQFMEEQFARLGLTATRIEALTPADLSESDVAAYCDPLKPNYMSPNMFSCAMSHERVWQTMLAAGDNQALILEDDAELSSLLPHFLEAVGNFSEELIRIETTGARTRVYSAHEVTQKGLSVRRFRSTPMGSAGYVLRRSAAEKLLGHPRFRTLAIDLAMYSPFEEPGALLTRSLVDPALCRQLGTQREGQSEIGRSNIDTKQVLPRTYADLHPVKNAVARMRRKLRTSLRNAVDHVREQRNGLTSKHIDFAP